VTIEELLETVWPRVVVTHQSVYNTIAHLRHTLGDSSASPVYIATVSRKGYRLVAPVSSPGARGAGGVVLASTPKDAPDSGSPPLAGDSAVTDSGAAAPQPASTRASHRPALLAGVAVAAVLLVVVATYAVRGDRGARERRAAQEVAERSVAVLPFLDLSEPHDQQYLADGLTEELINSLSQIPGLRVPARTSSFYFRGKQERLADIGTALQVSHVLEGSVRSDGGRLRITVQLIDVRSGFHRWSRNFDSERANILDVESAVATSVANQFKIALAGDDLARLAASGTRNADAYDAYLRGEQRLVTAVDRQSDTLAALQMFDKAIALDPNFALAHAARARALDVLAIFHSDSGTRDQFRADALAAGQRAIALAPQFGEAHAALGITRAYGMLDFGGAAPDFERALALSPGNARVLRTYAEFATSIGRNEAAIAAAQRSVSLDPENPSAYVTLSRALSHANQFAGALAALRDADKLLPHSNWVNGSIAGTLIDAGQFDQARDFCLSTTATLDEVARSWCLALAYNKLGRQTEAEEQFDKLKALLGDGEPFALAEIYASWGRRTEALEWLRKAELARAPELQSLKANARLRSLQDDPEFKQVLARMKFPD
jgi:TolB-like protein/Tfp pilus assembly protein PilF